MVTDQAVEDHGSTRDRETIHDLRQEIDAYRTQVRRLTTDAPAAASTSASAAVDNDRSTLLAEVLKSRQQIDQLTQKLKAAQSQSTHSKSRGGSALGTLHAMEDRLVQVENERDHERRQHEHQIKKILKATGGYDKAHFDRLMGGDNSNHGTHERPPVDLSDEIVDLFRQSQDDERLKVGVLSKYILAMHPLKIPANTPSHTPSNTSPLSSSRLPSSTLLVWHITCRPLCLSPPFHLTTAYPHSHFSSIPVPCRCYCFVCFTYTA